ncbi:MAG: sialidase family protein [Desulfobacteraceae bacterium]
MYRSMKKRQGAKRRHIASIMLAVSALIFLGAGQSGWAAVDEIITISDISPYPSGVDCNGTPQTGTVWRNSETEPYMEVDFGRPERMVAIVHQDRWSNGSAQSTATFFSDDGGLNWTLSHTPITRCSGGLLEGPESFDRASDPWLAVTPGKWGFGHRGRYGKGAIFHQMSLMTDRLPPYTGELRSAYSMLRSMDGGRTWSDPVVVSNRTEFESGAPFNDKNSLTADPYKPRFVYGTWQLLKDVQQDDGSAIPLQLFYSDTYFVRTHDTGRSWEPARAIYKIRNDVELLAAAGIDPSATTIYGAQNIGHQIAVLPDGRLVNVSRSSFITSDTIFLERTIIRSFDNGETWEQTGKIIPSATIGGYVGFDYELSVASGGTVNNTERTAGSIPDIAVNRTNGFIYVVWQDVDPTFSFIGVFMTMSKDGGDTWSEPITVGGGDPTVDGFASYAQLPAVHVADDGTVGVLFFDDRNDVLCPDLTLSNEENPECFTVLPGGSVQAGPLSQDWYFKSYGPDLNFQAEERVTPESFDLRQAPNAGGYFPGDYVNCTSADNDFVCAFTRTHNQGLPVAGNPPEDELRFDEFNRQDMVFVRIQGESVCNFKHTLHSFISQLGDAQIDIPVRRKIERLKYLKSRYASACRDRGDNVDD